MSANHKTLSGLFLAAAKRIEQGRGCFICDAIGVLKSYPRELRTQAKDIVKDRLGSYLSYTSWVRSHHLEIYRQSESNGTVWKDKREGRIAWCHALAEEFKDK